MSRSRKPENQSTSPVEAVTALPRVLFQEAVRRLAPVRPMRTPRIAVEEAFVTQEVMDAWDRLIAKGCPGEPGFKLMGDSILKPGPATEQVHGRLRDLGEGRIRAMDATGIDFAVLSLTSPGVQVFEADEATALAAHSNDVLAEAVQRYPDRYAGLCAIAPQDPNRAAKELERACSSLNMRGVMINSHTKGEYLDDPKFRPILEAANALKAPIYLHPRTPAPSWIGPFQDYGLYFAGWGFAAETGLHALRLIMAGVFKRYPDLRIILGHMGEGIPFYLSRIDNRYHMQVKMNAAPVLEMSPADYFKEFFYITTSGITCHPSFRMGIDRLGADRMMFAADYPYEDVQNQVDTMDAAPLLRGERNQIYAETARRVFRLTK